MAFVVGRNGDVLILDRMTSTIYTYDREDQFTRKYPLGDLDIKDIALLDDSLLILRGSEHRAGDKFHVVNRNSGEAVCSFYPMNDRVFTIWRHNHFYHYKGKMLLANTKIIIFMRSLQIVHSYAIPLMWMAGCRPMDFGTGTT